MRAVKGEITVFLSLAFTLLLSFIFGILESAVVQTSKNLSRIDTDRAIYSVFGEYHQELLEQYHVFGIDLGYRTGDYSEENLINRMHYYNSGSTEHEIKGIQYLTDQSGQAFREQVLAYMEQRYGVGLIRDFTGLTEDWEQTELEESDMENKTNELIDALDQNQTNPPEEQIPEGEESRPVLSEEENPFGIMQKIKTDGILSVVIPEGKEISGKSIDLSRQVSQRTLKKGRGSFPKRKGTDRMTENLLYNEYLLKNFGYAFCQENQREKEQEQVNMETDAIGERKALDYELEYILQGKSSDKENLEAVLSRLFLIRMAVDYGCLIQDAGRVAEAETLALTISTLLLIPEAAEGLKQMILIAWAGGESVMDLRCLLDGRKVPLVKNAENWTVSLSQLPTLLTDGGSVRGNESGEGIGYSDYLRTLLFLKSSSEITMRTLDCVENALNSEKAPFCADQCVAKLEIQNKITVYGNLTYQYPVYFGYE